MVNRRHFLHRALLASASLAWPSKSATLAWSDAAKGWRVFELTTSVEVLKPTGVTRAWLPTALTVNTPYQRALGHTFRAHHGIARFVNRPRFATGVIVAQWSAGVKPILIATSRVATHDHVVALTGTTQSHGLSRASLERYLQPTSLVPIDGIVKATATAITRDATTDLEKAHAIYDWIVDNTFRDPRLRGCGIGDIRFMLESGDLGGKCADLNALYVGLARAVGVPARNVYGVRLAKSAQGLGSLGVATEDVSRAQHCRAEVYLSRFGWVPVDPADVRKVVLEESPGDRSLDDPGVVSTRGRLFGSWEMNWMAYNFAHDVVLPGSTRGPIAHFMYPQCETVNGRLDSLDPDGFRYHMSVRELT